ncbi:hypothetical protein LguiB_002760 [Lonicera macranthoides]
MDGCNQEVPVIDMKVVEGEKIVKACEEWGCFRVVNHGVPLDLMKEMKAVAASLLDLPVEVKQRIPFNHIEGIGYTSPSPSSYIGTFFETMSLSDVASPDSVNHFLHQLDASPYQRKTFIKYSKAIYDLSQELTSKLVEGMGLEGELFKGWPCQFRLNKYNYSPESVGSVGIQLHTDPGFLTFLQDDESIGGFQVVDPNSKELVPVDPMPDTFIVNVGDVGKVWSNGRFCNVKHQVKCYKAGTRISFGLFLLGPKNAKLEAPPELVNSTHPRLYVPFDYNEHKMARIKNKSIAGEALELFRVASF